MWPMQRSFGCLVRLAAGISNTSTATATAAGAVLNHAAGMQQYFSQLHMQQGQLDCTLQQCGDATQAVGTGGQAPCCSGATRWTGQLQHGLRHSSRAFTSSHWHSESSSPEDTHSTSSSSTRGSKDMAIVFTCAKCDTRAVKAFSRQSYEKGLVLIKCPGCQSMHLIADHLGWFGDSSFKIDEYMAAQGQPVKRVSLDTPQPVADAASSEQLTAEDLAGWSKVQALLGAVAEASHSARQAQQAASDSCGSAGSAAGSGCGGDGNSPGPAGGQLESSSVSQLNAGVVQVAPEDVQGWLHVQQQREQTHGSNKD